ncbi:MAG TPA: GNAT family N-acetyltransferase [Bacillota bacterium]|nr:GNAT family N-acetyltransferase [Bacillota bacterium]HPZ40843.1 GNAT family N-acetyltransferase [Bacillota bacterium]HQD51802.1 GNAT family N-acetyltransferase [Bacillota bacterium]
MLKQWQKRQPQKFIPTEDIFSNIHAGDRIFISTGCGEPQYLVSQLVAYVEAHPKAFFDAEVLQVWTMGVAPYTDEKLKHNFRHNSFFISHHTRDAVNRGKADYTPIFLSDLPALFRRRQVPVDVALIQTSLPDSRGYLSLGISVDIVKAALENASMIVAQVNRNMPCVHGDGFIHIDEVDYLVPYDEPLLEYSPGRVDPEIACKIGLYVSRIIEDGDTIQVGYGNVPNAILSSLRDKKHLGIHTDLLSDGLLELMNSGVVDNSRKTINRGKTIASYCMGSQSSYELINDHPKIELKEIDYTNNPLLVAQHENMVAINSALEVDLTGQATAESIGTLFYSGIGGQAGFIRGAAMAPGGKTILALQSTTRDGSTSRIVPLLQEGAGVTLTRGDIQYVVTEYGQAYLHGKNIRERAMSLIAIAHPKFRSWLIEEAKKLSLIYKDQAFIPGKKGEYPEHLETYRTTKSGLSIFLRPVKISDETMLKDFFYSLSDKSLYQRFLTIRRHMPHEELQKQFVVIDYTKEMIILAVKKYLGHEVITGVAQYCINGSALSAEASIVVRDDFQKMGIGFELLSYLVYVAQKQGLHLFQANVMPGNHAVLRLIEKLNLETEKKWDGDTFCINIFLT